MASQQHFTSLASAKMDSTVCVLRRFAVLKLMNQNYQALTGEDLVIPCSKAGARVRLSRHESVEIFDAKKKKRKWPTPLIIVERPGQFEPEYPPAPRKPKPKRCSKEEFRAFWNQ